MRHRANPRFWRCYHALPAEVRQLADQAHQLLEQNPRHPLLQFKKMGRHWSARVGLHYPNARRGTRAGHRVVLDLTAC